MQHSCYRCGNCQKATEISILARHGGILEVSRIAILTNFLALCSVKKLQDYLELVNYNLQELLYYSPLTYVSKKKERKKRIGLSSHNEHVSNGFDDNLSKYESNILYSVW